jgi:endonuclease/exonuclease/phosphatase family metal-dependent hydrolase
MPLPFAAVLRKALKVTLVVVGLLIVAALAFLWWASGGDDEGAEWLDLAVEVLGPPSPPSPIVPERLTLLSWNMAYGRGPQDDLGDRRDRATVVANLEGIAAAIRAQGADVVALQEVDFDARRTHGIDQVAFLAERLGWPWAARATTWRNRYIPFPYWPPSQHLGAMHSGQAVLSRFPITRNGRLRYPQPDNFSFWYNAFYLNRATQVVDVQVGAQTVRVLNTHLEAYDRENREDQARRLVALAAREAGGEGPRPRLIVPGDFNAPPPEAAQRHEFVDEPEMDFRADRTIEILRAGLREGAGVTAEVVARDAALRGPDVAFTFPWGAPTRQLDHVFFGPGLALEEGGVVRPAGELSDHRPIRAVFRLVPDGDRAPGATPGAAE